MIDDTRVLVVRDPLPLAEVRSVSLEREESSHLAWLADGGRELVLATGDGRWIFLWVVDVERHTVRERVSLRIPGSSGVGTISQDGDRLWFTGYEGVLEMSRRDWKVLSWRLYRDGLPPEAPSKANGKVVPGTSYLWMCDWSESRKRTDIVLDLSTWQLKGRFPDLYWRRTVPAPDGALVLGVKKGRPGRLYRADGAPAGGPDLPLEKGVPSLAVAPDGRGFVQLAPLLNDDFTWVLRLTWLKPQGDSYHLVAGPEIREIDKDYSHRLVTSSDCGLCFVLAETEEEEEDFELRNGRLLMALSPAGGELRELYRVRLPYAADLVQDPECRSAAVLWIDDDGLQVLPLGPEPPAADRIPGALLVAPDDVFPRIDGKIGRPGCPRREVDDEILHLVHNVVRSRLPAGFQEWRRVPAGADRRFVAEHLDDPEALVRLGYAMVQKMSILPRDPEEGPEPLDRDLAWLCDNLTEFFPGHSGVALLAALREVRQGRWRPARRWLEAVEPKEVDGGRRSHYWLLWGFVLLHEERAREAYSAFRKASRYKFRSGRLDDLLLLTKPMSDPPRPGEWSVDQPLIRQLLGAIRTADRARRDGDLAAARAAVDRPVVWAFREIQSFGRLAAAVLESPARTPAERFHKRLVLNRFCWLGGPWGYRVRLQLPGVTWGKEEVRSVARRARAWLEAEVGDSS